MLAFYGCSETNLSRRWSWRVLDDSVAAHSTVLLRIVVTLVSSSSFSPESRKARKHVSTVAYLATNERLRGRVRIRGSCPNNECRNINQIKSNSPIVVDTLDVLG